MKKILLYFLIGIIPNSLFLLGLYLYDPLQLFHKPFFRNKNIIDTNMRFQAAGIINSWNFDSAFLGTSMLQNSSNFEAEKKLGGTWVNLSISAGSLYERYILLSYLLKKKKIHQVILTLEPFLSLQKIQNEHAVDFSFLYDQNTYNDFKIYLNEIFMLCMLQISSSCIKNTNPNHPLSWYDDPYFNQTFGGIQRWLGKYDNKVMRSIINSILNPKIQINPNSKWDVFCNLKKNLIGLIRNNPSTFFFLIIPPFSTLYYKLNQTEKSWDLWKGSITYLLHEKLPNLKIYGFDNEYFTNNIEYYRDLEHYDEKVNSFMLDAIKNDTHRITLENIDNYFEEMKKKVEAYDIESLRKQIIESGVLDK